MGESEFMPSYAQSRETPKYRDNYKKGGNSDTLHFPNTNKGLRDLAQLVATCTFSYNPYQPFPFVGSKSTNTLRCEQSIGQIENSLLMSIIQ